MGLFMDRSAALKLAIVLLVVVVLLLGIPLALPMGSGACPECPGLGAGAMAGSCLAILVGLLLHVHPRVISLAPKRLAARAACGTPGGGPRVRPGPTR